MDYLRWMGMAAKIQQRNEVVNRQCAELGERLKSEGYRYAILKGQGVASLYKVSESSKEFQVPSDLSLLRQSGDIDVWVQNKSIPELVEYVKGLGVGYKATAAHVECEMFPDTDVELHADPAFFRSFRNDRKLKRWFQEFNVSSFDSAQEPGFNVPSIEFNLVYMMVHMYHHVLFEGLGLRQLMDYYFVLRAIKTKTIKTADSVSSGSANLGNADSSSEIVSNTSTSSVHRLPSSAAKSSLDADGIEETASAKNIKNIVDQIESLGMMRFAAGIMWIMKEVFALEDKYLICEANEKYGRLVLEDVMSGGNFGHHDEKNKGLHGGTAVGRSLNWLKRNMKFFALGPWEILSSPLWSLWHCVWRKRRGYYE